MGKLRARIRASFRAKVLVPLIAVMGLLLALSMWIVNHRITRQFEAEARRALATADAVFGNSQKLRARYLLLRFYNLPNEPRYKAVFQTGDAPTVRQLLRELLAEQGVDFAFFAPEEGRVLAVGHTDPLFPTGEFQPACRPALRHALEGAPATDTVRVGDRLYDVVAVPVTGSGGSRLGGLVLGVEIGAATAQEFRDVTHSHIVLLANGRVIASTLAAPDTAARFAEWFQELGTATDAGMPAMKSVVLGGEHFFCSGGRIRSLNQEGTLGYLLLSSYEQPLRALRDTQQLLLAVSLAAIFLGSAVVWWLVNKVTRPLRELRDSVEAVGQGDFSRRVEVRYQDECGDLALAFNQMTENLRQSRAQLEETVQRLKTTQAQLIQSEKLSGIGEFVAGVAHELNNPLTTVMGFSELLKQQPGGDPAQQRYLDLIYKSAQRCHKIVQALLSFARRHQPERKPVSLNALVEAALEIVAYPLRTSNIEVRTRLEANLPPTWADPHQIQQVLLNLINNARQAIESHAPRGWIQIRTELSGSRLRLSVQDSGPGIAPEHLPKIFDPFFTTKEVGKGTGLGLSLCYGIIKEHGGSIHAVSPPGEGATFIVELPVADTATGATPESLPAPEADSAEPREGVGKRVLVIDDEAPILELVRETLSRRGFEVDVATDGETGLRLLGQRRYDLTLCDWKMPGLTGREVFERLRARDPAQSRRVIFITGDVVNEQTRRFLSEHGRPCLPKPFTLTEFREAVSRVFASS